MSTRLRRLIHGQTCAVCKRKRRVKWHYDTGCCSGSCLRVGMAFSPREHDYGYPGLRYNAGCANEVER